MNIEAWVQMPITVLNTLWAQAKGDNPSADLLPLTNGVRGFWRDISPNEIVNIIGSKDEVVTFYNTYQADIVSIDSWYQGLGFDVIEDELPLTDPARILSFMPDHPEGGGAPTFANPNWTHVFLGQPPDLKIFAGGFDEGFSGGMK